MADYSAIPLFPLQMVVFPDQTVPLYIFEPRYRQMFADVRAAAERGEVLPVGVVLGQDSEVQADVGCTVVLQQVLTEYEDGRLEIVTQGARRFRIDRLAETKSYLEAWVEYIDDEEEPTEPTLMARAQSGFKSLVEMAQEESGVVADVGVPETALEIAQAIALDLAGRQRLLEITTENGRLRALCEHLDQLIPMLEKRHQLRRRVHSNGHSNGHSSAN
ncbi:MAG: LON peptidase substrate-binding domain-containing protein [Candidatus Latescibacterota bacterium]|nr:LON peptidase substrate-binding domain-containing protein [Candidatus Latescibacterota bacterium]